MAMNNPYVDPNLKNWMQASVQALESLLKGPTDTRSIPTQKRLANILDIAPKVYELYGEQLGEGWLQPYLPQAGAAVSQPLYRAMQQYERTMSPMRATGFDPSQALYGQYQQPTGTSWQAQLSDAAHEAWKLGWQGQWYDPMRDTVTLMPSVEDTLREVALETAGTAGDAPFFSNFMQALGGPTTGAATSLQDIAKRTIPILSDNNPMKTMLQTYLDQAPTGITQKMIQDAVSFEGGIRKAASAKGPETVELKNALAGLAPAYSTREDYLADLQKHASEIITLIGLDEYRKLEREAVRYVQGGPAPAGADIPGIPQQALRTVTELFGKKPPQTEPGIDHIENLLIKIRGTTR